MMARALLFGALLVRCGEGLALADMVRRKLMEVSTLAALHSDPMQSDVAKRLQFGASSGNWRFSEAVRRSTEAAADDAFRRVSVVADLKRKTPYGAGGAPEELAAFSDASRVARHEVMRDWGVDAVCVNADAAYGGDVAEVRSVRAAFAKGHKPPLLMKDFVVDPIQVALAAEYGADAVVLVAAVLGGRLADLLDVATIVGIEAAVEVHTPDEARFALSEGATFLIANNRDRAEGGELYRGQACGLAHLIPPNIVSLAAGGIATMGDVQAHADAGFDGVLVGRALVSGDPDKAQALVRQARDLRLPRQMWA